MAKILLGKLISLCPRKLNITVDMGISAIFCSIKKAYPIKLFADKIQKKSPLKFNGFYCYVKTVSTIRSLRVNERT